MEQEGPSYRLPSWFPDAADALLAFGIGAMVLLTVWTGSAPDETFTRKPLSSVVLLAATLSLFWRRRAPLAVASVIAGGQLLQTALTGTFSQSPALALCLAVSLYSLGAHAALRKAVLGGMLIAGSIQLKGVIAAPSVPDESPFVELFWWLLCLSIVGLGVLVRGIRRSAWLQRELRAREVERAAAESAAVAEERQRIARELHDVVSHNVSATILQAGAAEELLRTDPERAGQALQSIQDMGREAIGEMRRMLGVMREGDETGLAPPQPRLADLRALVERVGQPGLEARLVVQGEVTELAPGVELSAYRIVQEALTNVAKHSNAANVVVTVQYDEHALEVEVTDDGTGTSTADRPGHGHLGMRERVDLFGGRLWTGPGPEGGYTVRARFPVERQSA